MTMRAMKFLVAMVCGFSAVVAGSMQADAYDGSPSSCKDEAASALLPLMVRDIAAIGGYPATAALERELVSLLKSSPETDVLVNEVILYAQAVAEGDLEADETALIEAYRVAATGPGIEGLLKSLYWLAVSHDFGDQGGENGGRDCSSTDGKQTCLCVFSCVRTPTTCFCTP